ncbi:MAG TPA: hypothetical protein VFG79_21710, partial [Solirubrobacter sp.]|nr:hypothetical protein [Solirubrobacter sp.]
MASSTVLRSLRGEGFVEFALSPGGYVRFGDDYVLIATPRSPRGPLTLPVTNLPAAPLAPGDTARIEDGVLRVGDHAIALW